MEYGIRELARMAGVSTRTLRYYDEIGLLRPARVTQAGYRLYGRDEAARLQQILFYRERGFGLKTVQQIMGDKDFDMLRAMEDHLAELEKQKAATEELIRTVRLTIEDLKGEYHMSDRERFRGLKEKMVADNEKQYGAEARRKYGDEQVDAANRRLMGLSEEQLRDQQTLEEEILRRLEAGAEQGVGAQSDEAREIAELHRRWLTGYLPGYTPAMHRGIAAMYIADERFTRYYDRRVAGCAQLLHDAVQRWI